MAWLVTITMTASYEKIFSANPRIGFLSNANALGAQLRAGTIPVAQMADTRHLIFNQHLDAGVTVVLATMVVVLIVEALVQWYFILVGDRRPLLHESEYVPTQWSSASDGGLRGTN